MPGSRRENDADLNTFIQDHDIVTVLDVGPGRGTYARLLKPHGLIIDCVEIFPPYVDRYKLHDQYRHVTIGDARTHDTFDYDLVIFGDVLEHMSRDDSTALWQRASQEAQWGLISIPIICYPQGASHGNPYEAHIQEHVTPAMVRDDYGPFNIEHLYETTGTFIRRFR